MPNWQAVLDRDYQPWPEPHLILDTAWLTPEQAIAAIERRIATAAPPPAS